MILEKDHVARAKEILSRIMYITIATASKDGKPWNTPVYSAFDERYNFFWVSSPLAQHSRNIEESNNAFLVVYDSTQTEGTGEGVYVKVKAFELNDEKEIEHALRCHYGRRNTPARPASDFMGTNPRRVYKAVPETFWINTYEKVDGHHVDGKVEIDL